MFLHQEYLERNSIDINWVGCPNKANVILRSKNPYRHRWVILQIQAGGVEYHPKHYDMIYLVPRKQPLYGRSNGNLFYIKKQRINWDQFDYTVGRWLLKAKRKFRIVRDSKDRELTLWEMFVLTHDQLGHLTKLPFESKKSLAISLDPKLSIENRYNSFESVKNVMENRFSNLYMSFHEKFLLPYLETTEFTNI